MGPFGITINNLDLCSRVDVYNILVCEELIILSDIESIFEIILWSVGMCNRMLLDSIELNLLRGETLKKFSMRNFKGDIPTFE